MQEVIFLARYARGVVVAHRRGRFRTSGTLLGPARVERKISLQTDTMVKKILDDSSVEVAWVRDARTDEGSVLALDGIFRGERSGRQAKGF